MGNNTSLLPLMEIEVFPTEVILKNNEYKIIEDNKKPYSNRNIVLKLKGDCDDFIKDYEHENKQKNKIKLMMKCTAINDIYVVYDIVMYRENEKCKKYIIMNYDIDIDRKPFIKKSNALKSLS